MRRVLRWWAGKGPAAKWKINRSATDLSALSNHFDMLRLESQRRLDAVRSSGKKPCRSSVRCPHRTREFVGCFC
ncbi:hypothetical protein XHV734_3684 [Xanthomonas hortorum pv. vitians]|nr:hypothetical protein XHV734_3684 [Xanthomonas hortorum pv. vitians]